MPEPQKVKMTDITFILLFMSFFFFFLRGVVVILLNLISHLSTFLLM